MSFFHIVDITVVAGMGLCGGLAVRWILQSRTLHSSTPVRLGWNFAFHWLNTTANHFLTALRKTRRREALKQAMPDLCDLLAAGLRSGLALRHALSQIAPRLPEPMQSEVMALLNDHRTGVPLPLAVGRFAQRLEIPSARLFSYCLQMSMHSGGSLSEALLRLSKAMRDQLGLEAKIRALTAQGLLQALVMLLIPPLLFLVMLSIDPTAADFFLGSSSGAVVLGLVVVLEVLGSLWIRKIIRIEV